jgi:hypothetical protein
VRERLSRRRPSSSSTFHSPCQVTILIHSQAKWFHDYDCLLWASLGVSISGRKNSHRLYIRIYHNIHNEERSSWKIARIWRRATMIDLYWHVNYVEKGVAHETSCNLWIITAKRAWTRHLDFIRALLNFESGNWKIIHPLFKWTWHCMTIF